LGASFIVTFLWNIGEYYCKINTNFYHYYTDEEKSYEFFAQIDCIKTNGAAVEYWKNNNK
jgi:hypothetical protein